MNYLSKPHCLFVGRMEYALWDMELVHRGSISHAPHSFSHIAIQNECRCSRWAVSWTLLLQAFPSEEKGGGVGLS